MRRAAALAIVSSPGDTGADTDPVRPRTRADCANGPRPCPWFGCKHHLAIDVTESGTIAVVGGSPLPALATDREIERFVTHAIERASVVGSCVLDLVEREPDGAPLRVIGSVFSVTRERIRQIETKALRPLGPRIRRRLGRVLEADAPVPANGITVEGVGR